jgi:hypothetical protein
MKKMTIDIVDYLGKHENGVIVLISLGYDNSFYEATFFYTKEILALTPEDSLEEKLECDIEDWEGYEELMIDIIKKVVPYEEIINIIGEFDPSKYDIHLDKGNSK